MLIAFLELNKRDRKGERYMAKNDTPKGVKCSFCGKTQDSVKKIVAGPGVYICNECVELCNEIIESEYYDNANDTYTLSGLEKIPSPREIKEILDQYVICLLYTSPSPRDCS